MSETCIFVDKPPHCINCLTSLKVRCLINHQHLIVSEEGKAELARLVEEECNNPRRYKTKSGQEQRPD